MTSYNNPLARTLALILAFGLLPGVSSVTAEHYRVYFLGGQSNANGRGDAAQLTGALASPQTDVQLYWHRTQVTNNVGHLTENAWIDLAPGSGHGTTQPVYAKEFGSEITFGRTMADADPAVKIAIIKYSHGGTNLHTQWSASGDRYASFISTAAAGLAALSAAGHTYELAGMIWHQGEADAGSATNAGNYEANLTSLIARVRRDIFGGPSLPFIIGSLSDSQNPSINTPGSSWYVIRQAQEAVAANGYYVGFVDTDGYTTRPNEAIHFDHEAQIDLGEGFAAEFLRLEAHAVINDADYDGVSTADEATLGTDPNVADTDRDGQNDGLEVRAGTDPLNIDSFFGISDRSVSAGQVEFSWPSKPGNKYTVELSTNLVDWTVIDSDLSASAASTTTWVYTPANSTSSIIASYTAPSFLNGDFDTTDFDSNDTDSGSTASRLSQDGSLTGGGSAAFVLDNALFDSSDSGSPGFNLAGVNTATQATAAAAGDSFRFSVQSGGSQVTYRSLTFFCDQNQTTAKVDVSYSVGGVETFILQDLVPPGSNAPVGKQTVDFTDFSSSEDVTWIFYLYGAGTAVQGTRFDDITLRGEGVAIPPPARAFYRLTLQPAG